MMIFTPQPKNPHLDSFCDVAKQICIRNNFDWVACHKVCDFQKIYRIARKV